VRRTDELLRLRADWERLAAHAPGDGLFRGYAWNALWFRHVAPQAVPHVVTVLRGGETVGLAPLCETTYEARCLRLRALGFAGRDVVSGDFLDLLAAPGCEEAVRDAVLAHVAAELDRVPLFVLGDCLRDSATARRAAAFMEACGRRARWQEERACPAIDLPRDFGAYVSTLSQNTRYNLRRRPRQLREAGCEILRLRGGAEILPRLGTLFRLHEARWLAEGQRGHFVRPGFREFLEAFVAAPGPGVSPELYVLDDPGGPVAALLFFRRGGVVHFYQGGWDPASPHARLSPCLALFARAIEDAIADGCRRFEFLRGDEAYKRKLAPAERRTATLVVAGRGLLPRLYLAVQGFRSRAAGRAGPC
jgi:CelD/BcsL family acetyltransferase involved in cellulose biosynthesis